MTKSWLTTVYENQKNCPVIKIHKLTTILICLNLGIVISNKNFQRCTVTIIKTPANLTECNHLLIRAIFPE